MKIKTALISVYDKTGIVDFARELQNLGIDIISTGGTYNLLTQNGIKAKRVEDITGFPEMFNGRVKTLHPKILGGILAVRDNPEHIEQLKKFGIIPIDLVVVNLYPFSDVIRDGKVTIDEAIEEIDIGGVTLLRASAKNYKYVVGVVNPDRYEQIIYELKTNNCEISERARLSLAIEVFRHTSDYDAIIANFLSSQSTEDVLPEVFHLNLPKVKNLRYGENPHQRSALYGDFFTYFEHLHGKELSYNNILDISSATELILEFDKPACAIVKHTNPCGVGIDESSTLEAFKKAFATDTVSAFGGIVAFNRPIDFKTAMAIDEVFFEVIIAPEFPSDVLNFLMRKKNRRLIRYKDIDLKAFGFDFRKIIGGVLVQEVDQIDLEPMNLRVVTRRKPTVDEMEALIFAWKVVKHIKSNAIVYAKKDRTLGIGAGQMSRVDSSKIAVMKAKEMGHDLRGSVVASDAFFPFPDGLIEAAKAGATAVIQPGGSIRDEDVIKAADEYNIAMVFTGIRHFKH
ncbi:phosphoribosylaminoimidazolecarboxamide formyltransferase / IMP cyclohydrolase [Candidatus Kryptonium thompsonii]|uniref:Bifunctional purine biosynthesis protein PurH n=1 Tax=Candidatus Kryptonium thompsonii TaxID=1633631 RepID=A0A0P1M5L5_9BACT|nr:bifunctional phosphoribosylaminoimidazolecarboxamide formyltransferase/IMP cyclohydrolase [Candidatus Kryptonium thompsoni]CUS77502.1 phosphoribosylaminoimidazolecarboxamide formyltransferase / IMP cyclohydrolase [Candidatus Kryptonium thompsoni]CUS79470.1 phosphoribosylaminoimidazolecarboxamide formyltransferase / IMP cyclohydrolase [Candidatus Kryptonium thompsoni]CUS84649.1 phosphoribosylaminoimidazolecarboxamide formyltransferase / IMP cyclohydrolase [Candidatus Kryptonium thompsoni]CUS9